MKPTPNYKDPDYIKFLEQMKIIGLTESGNNYDAQSSVPGQTATGKYQYNATHLDSIKKFSKEIGMPVNTLEEFKQNRGLQEAYFAYDQYKGYQWAKARIASKNPFNYNMAELAALRHFQGEGGADKILTTGKHKEADKKLKNPGTKEYIEGRFRKELKSAGLYVESAMEKNQQRAKNIPRENKLKIQEEYENKLDKIRQSNYDAVTENVLIRQLNQQYFDDGNLEIVNQKIDFRNNKANNSSAEEFSKKKALRDAVVGVKANEGQYFIGNLTNDKELAELAKAFGEDPKRVVTQDDRAAPFYDARDYWRIDPTSKTGQFLMNPTEDTIKKQMGPVNTTSRINLNEYVRESQIAPLETTAEETEVPTQASAQEQAIAQAANPMAPAVPAAPDRFEETELMNILNGPPTLFQDEQFQYKPGGIPIPFDAVGGLIAGFAGIEAGNTDIPARNEEVSEGLRNYGAELQRIKEMGLPPEIEASLKMKAANVYQTGLDNIVRASGGNRNLVLGNQGQLDMIRQNAITDIALMDLDRRDKAMADYGEIMKYMDQFYANRDIANNEREYQEAIKTQMAGAQLASQGFASFMDSLRYAKENGPGSANDMYRQYLMYSITGVNPGIDDDGSGEVPGTASYAEAQQKILRGQQTEREKIKSFYGSQDKEGKAQLNTFLKENESLRPDINPAVTFDQFKTEFDVFTGNAANKEAMQLQQNTLPEDNYITIDDQALNAQPNYQAMPELNAYSSNPPTVDIPEFGNTPTAPWMTGSTPDAQMAAAQQKSKQAQDRFRGSVDALQEYLDTQGSKVNQDLDSLIEKTEKDTQAMTNQLQSKY